MAYKKKTIIAGRVKNVYYCHTARNNSSKRPKQKNQNPTPEQQKKNDERRAYEKIDLLINANFKADDLYITLTYNNNQKEPTPAEAKVIIRKYLDRLRYLYEKKGLKIKYIGTTEHVKGRMHHHLLINKINGIGSKQVKKLWDFGFVTVKLYIGEPEDAERLAAYFVKESNNTFNTDKRVHGRRYISSRSLIIPEPKIETVSASTWREEVKPSKGYYIVLDRKGETAGGYPYRFVRMIKIPGCDENEYDSRKACEM